MDIYNFFCKLLTVVTMTEKKYTFSRAVNLLANGLYLVSRPLRVIFQESSTQARLSTIEIHLTQKH